MFKAFTAKVVGSVDFITIDVAQGVAEDGELIAVMNIITPIMDVQITREQAMEFFGLVPAMLPRAAALTAFIANMPAKRDTAMLYPDAVWHGDELV